MPPRPGPLGPAPAPGSLLPPNEKLPTSELYCLKGHEGPVLAVRFNTQGTYCLSCGKVRLHLRVHERWHQPAPSCAHAAAPRAAGTKHSWAPLRASHSPHWVQDRTVRLWNPHRGIPIKIYSGHGYDVRDAAVVSDNSK